MDANRFDTISKLFASRKTRRAALKGTGAGIAAAAVAPLAGRVAAQDATPAAGGEETVHPNASSNVTELFTQAFEGGTWEQAGSDDTYTLTLTGTAAQTVYFADRPERFFGLMSMQDYIDTINAEPTDPPNAALITRDPDSGAEDILIIELANPQYNASSATLTYDATMLTDYQQEGLSSAAIRQQDYDFPASFGHGGLFIDGVCNGHDWVQCTVTNTGEVLPTVKVGECWDTGGWGCEQCHSNQHVCEDTYWQCNGKDSNGDPFCTGENVSPT